jgi:hypothetical protein
MKSKHRKGLLLHADDLEIGAVCTVHHWNDHQRHFWCGDALVVKAINLPFIVAKFAAQPQDWPSITLDLREVALMPVSPDFVEAQKGGYSANLQQMPPRVWEDQND